MPLQPLKNSRTSLNYTILSTAAALALAVSTQRLVTSASSLVPRHFVRNYKSSQKAMMSPSSWSSPSGASQQHQQQQPYTGSTTTTSMNTNASQSQSQVLYQPTQQEEAYGEYLLEEVFSIQSQGTTDIRISGRDAVQFLSKSDVDRHILRTLWTVADPENYGRVVSVSQWMILLRLVALAQSNYVVSASASASASASVEGLSVQALQTILAQTSSSQITLPLAVFSGIPIPDAQTLQSRGGGPQQIPVQQQQMPQTPEPSGWGAMDALASPTDKPLSGMMGMQMQSVSVSVSVQQTPNKSSPAATAGNNHDDSGNGNGNGDFGDFESSSASNEAAVEASGWDAMDALAAAPTDVPLPSLSQQSPGMPNNQSMHSQNKNGDDDDFGDFAGTQNTSSNEEAPLPAADTIASVVAPAVEVSGWGAMDALAAPADTPLPSLSQQHQHQSNGVSNKTRMQSPNDNDNEDDFGDFTGTNNTSSNAPAVEVSGWDALDALAAPANAPLPSMSHQSPGISNNQSTQSHNVNDGDDFGDFESPSGSNEAAAEVFGWGAMDALSASADTPLPSMSQQNQHQLNSMVSDTSMQSQNANANDDNDDFGDFAGTNKSSNETSVPPASGAAPTVEAAGWDALDALAAPADAPLPSISHQSPGISKNQSMQSQNDLDDGDDFGDFESPSGSNEAPVQNALDATTATAPAIEASGWDAMDALAAATDAPLPSLAHQSPGMMSETTMQSPNDNDEAGDDDDFGDFAGTNNTSSNGTPVPPAAAPAVEASGWGAMDALVAPSNASLPSLIRQSSGISRHQSMQSPNDDDEFGNFAATNSSETPMQPVDTSASDAAPAIEASGWDALDALAAPSNAPLPSLSHQSSGISSHQSMQSQDDDDDDFGDFVATSAGNDTSVQPLDAITSATAAPAVAASGWDAGDDLAAPSNAPLPSLIHQSSGISSHQAMQSQDDDANDFGDFAVTNGSNETSSQPVGTTASVTAISTVEASGWDAMDDLAAPSNAPLSGLSHQSSGISSHQSIQSDDDDDFGDFAGNGGSSEAPVLPVDTTSSVAASGWDALDALPATANAPLPSLDHQLSGISTSPPTQAQHGDDDDFGDFAGTASSEPLAAEEGAQPRVTNDLIASEAADSNNASGSDDNHLIVEPSDSGDFGDFLGTESSVSQNNASSAFRLHPEDTSNGVHPQSQESADFGHAKSHAASTKKPPLPPSGSRSVQNPPTAETLSNPYSMERADSAFYSARTHSAGTHSAATFDDLGDFEDAVEISDDYHWPEGRQGEASPNEKEVPPSEPNTVDSDDPFAAFDTLGSPPPSLPPLPTFNLDSYLSNSDPQNEVVTATKSQESAKTSEEKDADDNTDDFGDFEAVPIQKSMGTDVVSDDNEDEIEDDFGDFAGFESGDGESNVEPGLLGFSSVPAQGQAPAVVEDDFGDFGDFEAPPYALEAPNDSAMVVDANGDADEFGDFESVDAVDKPLPSDVETTPQEDPDVDEFGDFSTFGPPPEVPAAPAVTTPDVQLDDPERQKLVFVRKYLAGQSQQLPEVFRTQLGKPGSHVDFGDCFDANIGLDTPVSDNRKKRAQRCAQLLGLLSSTHSKLASTYWAQAIEVARDELTMGSVLLEEASGLSSAEKKIVQQALETMVFGLGEFVRVARLIAASIGDLLMLDDTALLTIDTFASSWCSMAMLNGYLEVEKLWKNVEKLGKLLGLSRKADSLFPLDSLVDIRRRAAAAKASDRLCQFTLQPLSKVDAGKSTKAPVRWNGHPYMACTANLLAHKFVF